MKNHLCARHLILSCALVALAWPLRSSAHDLPTERGVLVQMSRDRVEIMLTYSEPAGEKVDLLKARFDFDKNGRIDPAEAKLAGQTWLGPALAGLTFEVVGEHPRAREPEIKFREEADGGIAMAALVRYDLPDTNKPRTFRVALAKRALKTTAHFISGEGLAITRVGDRDISPTRSSGPYVLRAEQSQRVTFAPEEPAPKK